MSTCPRSPTAQSRVIRWCPGSSGSRPAPHSSPGKRSSPGSGDELSRQRRELPWVRVDKSYVFDGPASKETLADLFDGRSQLIVYHFMFSPEWNEGCKHCSFWADNFDRLGIHLNQRDVTMIAVSRAPLDKIAAFRQRMGMLSDDLTSCDRAERICVD